MWIFQKDILKTFAVKDEEFDLIHKAIDGWISYDYPQHLLFEANGSFYIANNVNSGYLGFNNVICVNSAYGTYPLSYNGSQWIWYTVQKDQQWFKKGIQTTVGNFYFDLSNNTFKPFNIKSGSDAIANPTAIYNRQGAELYKSNTLLGTYVWDGLGSRDDIVVGYRKYKHIFESTDYFATETLELLELSANNWQYIFQGVTYSYSGELPLENFTMTSSEGDLNMIYQELVTITRDILHFDGGAQIVD